MAKYIILSLFALSFMSGFLVAKWKEEDRTANPISSAHPPKLIVICGIADRPCVSYTVSYHQATGKYGDAAAEGYTDYRAKTISIASSPDPFENVQALLHEVYHAALWERGFKDNENWKVHDWIYFSEGPFSILLHDNPELMRYIASGY